MKSIVAGLAVIVATATPTLAGRDWYDDDYDYEYERYSWRGEYRTYSGAPVYRAPAYEIYIPYGAYFEGEQDIYAPGCKIERKWRRGRYKEKIECDDDD